MGEEKRSIKYVCTVGGLVGTVGMDGTITVVESEFDFSLVGRVEAHWRVR